MAAGHNRMIKIKPIPVPLCPTQISHVLNWDQTWATTMGITCIDLFTVSINYAPNLY